MIVAGGLCQLLHRQEQAAQSARSSDVEVAGQSVAASDGDWSEVYSTAEEESTFDELRK